MFAYLFRSIFSRSLFLTRNMSSVPCTSQCGPLLLESFKSIVPKLTHEMHKGNCGRIGVVGGSAEYTGAPYFAGISALKAGADLAHIMCPQEASVVIKTYSPELIVHPFSDAKNSFNEISLLVDRLHSVVIGPGMGRSSEASIYFKNSLDICKSKNIPIVIDGDGLYFVCQDISAIEGFKNIILTPNVVEFDRLYQKVNDTDAKGKDPVEGLKHLCTQLGNVTIVRKGEKDIISNGTKVVICDSPNSPRRCGGQGDLMSGSMATYFHWALNAAEKNCSKNKQLEELGPSLIAAYSACLMTKECNRLAFEKFGRSTVTTNMIDVIHLANMKLLE